MPLTFNSREETATKQQTLAGSPCFSQGGHYIENRAGGRRGLGGVVFLACRFMWAWLENLTAAKLEVDTVAPVQTTLNSRMSLYSQSSISRISSSGRIENESDHDFLQVSENHLNLHTHQIWELSHLSHE